MSLLSYKESMVEVCHLLQQKGYVSATDGNCSIRLPADQFLVTPASLPKGRITEDDLVIIDMQGRRLMGERRASTEYPMHMAIYRGRPDLHAVVHAHPPYATGFAVAGLDLGKRVLPEVIVNLGSVPLAAYATPSTEEVGHSLLPLLETHDVILLQNHGVVAAGIDMWDAYYKLEKAEHAAMITFIARMLGGERELTKEELERLADVSPSAYGKAIR